VTYTAAAVVGVIGALVIDLAILRTRLVTRRVFWLTYPIVLAGQLLANGVLTGARVVTYRPDAIVGWRVAYAPVEDLGFGFALVLVTLALWVWLGRRGLDRTPLAGDRARQFAGQRVARSASRHPGRRRPGGA
jgi:lycopene cyclase domain-containing protein